MDTCTHTHRTTTVTLAVHAHRGLMSVVGLVLSIRSGMMEEELE